MGKSVGRDKGKSPGKKKKTGPVKPVRKKKPSAAPKKAVKKSPAPPAKKAPAAKKAKKHVAAPAKAPAKPVQKKPAPAKKSTGKKTAKAVVRTEPKPAKVEKPATPLRTPIDEAPLPQEEILRLTQTIGKRRFRVENAFRKPTSVSRLIPQATWEEVIFSVVSEAGKQGITVESLSDKAIAVKYDKNAVRSGIVTPYTRFHNSSITNIQAICRYLDNPAFRNLYGYREIKR